MVTVGLHRGFTGFLIRRILASSGVRSALPVVASPTSRHDVVPGLSPAFGDGHDVVERQFFGAESAIAILAAIAVARKDVDAGKLYSPMTVLKLDELQKPHHRRKLDRDRDAVDFAVVDFEDLDLPLPEQGNGLLPMQDTNGS